MRAPCLVLNAVQCRPACRLQGRSQSSAWVSPDFTAFVVLPDQDEDVHASLADVALKPAGQATIALEVVALAAMLPFLYIEVASAIEYGRSWFDIQNLIDACTYINQACAPQLWQSHHNPPKGRSMASLCPAQGVLALDTYCKGRTCSLLAWSMCLARNGVQCGRLQASGTMVASWSRLVHPCLQGTRAALWMSLVSILAKLGTLQMEQLRNQALVILQRSVSPFPCTASALPCAMTAMRESTLHARHLIIVMWTWMCLMSPLYGELPS